MKDPATPDEWAEAIHAAVFCIGLAAAEDYGLITGPDVDVARAEAIIDAGRQLGYPIPTLDDVIDIATHRQLPDQEPAPNAQGRGADRAPGHGVYFDEDGDGWTYARCTCGWTMGPFPSEEDAADAYGDHRGTAP